MPQDPTPRTDPLVLRKSDIEAMPGTDKVHFLNPNAKRTNKSLGDATGLTGFGFHWIEIPVGCVSTEMHRHHHEDECVYVLEGHAVVVLDERRIELEAGDFVGLPKKGPAHLIENPGPGPLRCLVVGERRSHDVAEYTQLNKVLFRNEGEWSLVDQAQVVDPKAKGSTVGSK